MISKLPQRDLQVHQPLPSPAASPSPEDMTVRRPPTGCCTEPTQISTDPKSARRPNPTDTSPLSGRPAVSDDESDGESLPKERHRHIASPAALATYERLGSLPGHSEVYRVDEFTVLKTGRDVTREEAGALGYLNDHAPGIPVPELLDYGVEPTTGHNYIVMRYVEGDNLWYIWDTLDDHEKSMILVQLRAIFDRIRNIRDTEVCGFVPESGNAGTSGPRAGYRKSGVTDNFFAQPQGPFHSEGGLLHALAAHLQLRGGPSNCWLNRVVMPLLFSMPAHPPLMVLTHGELNAKNILVKDGKITAVLDWSQAGFYPTYWEFVKAFFGDIESSVFVRDDVISHILDQRYDSELAVMMLAKDIIW